MVTLSFFFYFNVILFGLVGGMRGWAKELLVSFSVILAMFIIVVLERFVPFLSSLFAPENVEASFYARSIIVVLFAFFGYQTPNIPRIGGARFARERLQDILLGFVLGGVNGYLIVGTLWYFMAQAGYPFQDFVVAPTVEMVGGAAALDIMKWLPPVWLGIPAIYFAIAIAFAFVVIVFI